MRKFLLFGLISVFCLFLTACGNDAANSPATDEEAASTERWNAYVDLSNKSDEIMDISNDYITYVGRDSEPRMDKLDRLKNRANVNFVEVVKELAAAVLAQAESSGQTELDKAAKTFAENVNADMAIQQEARQYYGAKSYVDDQLAKGKEMHPRILATYDALEASYIVFSELMAEENRQAMLRDVQEMRDDGAKVLPAVLNFMIVAQSVAAKLPDEEGIVLDHVAIKPDYDQMVKALDELLPLASDEDAIKEEGLSIERMGNIATASTDIKGILTAMMERAANGQPPKSPEGLKNYMNRLNSCIGFYNDLVQSQGNISY